jgi:hypothetical protein
VADGVQLSDHDPIGRAHRPAKRLVGGHQDTATGMARDCLY